MGGNGVSVEGGVLEEADHRIANHLALLASFVRLKARDLAGVSADLSRASVTTVFESFGVQLDAVARLHRSLSANGQQSSTNLSERLREICENFRSGLSSKVQLTEEFEPACHLAIDQLLPVTQIFAEVVTNAVKHGHSHGGMGSIHARCSNQDGGGVLVEVIDHGDGLPEMFDPETDGRLGFRLVRALGKQLGARIQYQSSGEGLHFHLALLGRDRIAGRSISPTISTVGATAVS